MRAPTTVEAGRLLTVTGVVKPARTRRLVQLWELRGDHWLAVAEAPQRRDGAYTIRMRAGALGRHTYRVVTPSGSSPFSFNLRSKAAVVATVKPSTPGVRSTRLAATTPLGAHSGHGQQYGEYATGTVDINGKRYPDSVRTVSYDVSYELGAAASTFEAALALTPTRRGPALRQGPRLVQITVDGIFRVNRFLRDGETVPVRLDVRGRRVVRIISNDSGTRASSWRGSDLLLGTPVVTSRVLSERGTVAHTLLSNLPRLAVRGPTWFNRVHGAARGELFQGSVDLYGSQFGRVWGTVSYDLGGRYTRLTGLAGIFGEADSSLSGRVRVYGDDRLLADLPALIWSYRRSVIDITGVRRLRIEPTGTSMRPEGWWGVWYIVFGDVRLTSSPP
jgi:hypothetical protein